jgi:AcrR family transcriptional regulator
MLARGDGVVFPDGYGKVSGNWTAGKISMNEPTIDKRSKRTRDAIETALLYLIECRGYDSVTVRDICDEAKVSRSTFYAHYAGKDEVKRSGLRHLRLALDHRDATDAHYGGSSLERTLFEHGAKYRSHYRALVRGGGAAVALESVRKIVADAIRAKLSFAGTDAKSRESAVHFLAGGYVGLLTRWLDSDETMPPSDVGAVLRRWSVPNAP